MHAKEKRIEFSADNRFIVFLRVFVLAKERVPSFWR